MPKGDNLRGKKPLNTPKGPSTRAEVENRVMQVGKFLIQGYQRFEIVSLIQKEYSVSPQQIDKYIKEATERIREKNSKNLDDETEIIEARILDIYQLARQSGRFGDAIRALKLHMDLRGLVMERQKEAPGGLCIREEDLEEYRDDDLTPEEKKMVQDITGLKDLY